MRKNLDYLLTEDLVHLKPSIGWLKADESFFWLEYTNPLGKRIGMEHKIDSTTNIDKQFSLIKELILNKYK